MCVPSGDSKAIVEAVKTYYNDREKLNADGEAGYNYVIEHFEREKIAGELSRKLMEEF